MAKDRMEAGRGRSGPVKPAQKGSGGGAGGGGPRKKVEVRGSDRRPFYVLLGAIAVAAAVFIGWQMMHPTYKAAGGDIQFELFEGAVHNWVEKEGPLTDRAHEMVKAFIARQLGARASR